MFLNPHDNLANLPPGYIDELDALPDRQRKRFFLGEYVDEIDGALWTIEAIDQHRVDTGDCPHTLDALFTAGLIPQLVRVVVAVDPSGTSGEEDRRSDAIGIVTAGLGIDGVCYVLEDATCQLPPAGWGHRAVEQFDKWEADHIIAEVNYGGDMVRYVIEQADRKAPVRVVSASRGKAVRAEPVSAFYDKGLVRHVGRFPQLEDQMLSFSTAGYLGERSPVRADALVWAITDLAVGTGTPAHTVPASQLMVEPMRRAHG
jgi:phage terminase large subunit-like protein